MTSDFLAYNARNLLPYLLLASPIVLLAVWLSVRNGLRPLQLLADRIRSRTPGELQPVGFDARHRELVPLVHALDDLLASARHKLARERAFVQDAAHELRTPLAVVTAQAHVLARSPDAHERAQAAPQLEQAVLRAAHLAQQLLELARLDEAQRPPAEPVDLAALLREALAEAFPAARARRIELALEAPEHLHQRADPMAVRSIATNLVDNAVRYSGGGQVRATLANLGSGGWSLLVQDDGVGIAPAEHGRVFERFYRSAGQAESGAGLGLAIVRQAALRLGGGVRIAAGLHGRGVGLLVEVPAAPAGRS
ncbi:ATP-binding protein [Pseudorhodoferax sp.]|uniref:ATP-binding protein n=1 Tax=Pseudorhodoferax sp. TaxID=1993553 RepID=UPI002DD62932|nr:ATP-binding protein [Pseudorhodoferax sp.]